MAAQMHLATDQTHAGAQAAWRAQPQPSSSTGPASQVLELALAQSLEAANRALGSHEHVVALALSRLGSIDLPASASPDGTTLQPLAPLYLVHELDQAGLLRAAEQVAGLFAGGAVTQDLGPVAARIAEFWQGRQQRLSEAERGQMLEQAFETRYFYPLMQQLCSALVAISDNAGVADLREEVGLEQAAVALSEFLAQRATGMVTFAARDLLNAVTAALAFLRERTLQTAFGVRDLWALVGLAAGAGSGTSLQIRSRVDLARAGSTILTWLADSNGNFRPDTLAPQTQALALAAQRWLLAHQSVDRDLLPS
jgi:hypothetical protein